MAKKLYALTPEHSAQLAPWANRWIANAVSTAPMTDGDRQKCRDAVLGLYAAANLPAPKHIVFVPSPFVLTFASGFAASIWHRFHNGKRAATEAATRDATWAATDAATRAATEAATRAATWAATEAATDAATRAATDATAERFFKNWYVVPCDMGELAQAIGVGDFGLQCAARAWDMWHGGNQWSAWDSYISFFRHVSKLELDYSKWQHWETLSLHSGPRIMHPDFCMISDRPEVLLRDARNRPHCDDGPFCRWRDGTALYSVHGVRVPAWIIERPQDLTVEKIDGETNAEVRRVMVERYGFPRFMKDAGAEILDHDEQFGTLFRRNVPGDEPIVTVEVVNRTPEGTWQNIAGWMDGLSLDEQEAIIRRLDEAERNGFGVPTLQPHHGQRFVPQLKDGKLDFKRYMLRVSPDLRPLPAGDWPDEKKRDWLARQKPQAMTARNAVASTFGRRGEQYAPVIES